MQENEVMVVVSGKQAMVRKDWAPLIIKKHALVSQAKEANKLGDDVAIRSIMGKLISINRQIARKGAYIRFID